MEGDDEDWEVADDFHRENLLPSLINHIWRQVLRVDDLSLQLAPNHGSSQSRHVEILHECHISVLLLNEQIAGDLDDYLAESQQRIDHVEHQQAVHVDLDVEDQHIQEDDHRDSPAEVQLGKIVRRESGGNHSNEGEAESSIEHLLQSNGRVEVDGVGGLVDIHHGPGIRVADRNVAQ